MSAPPQGKGGLPPGFQKLFRTALIIIPIGVLGNIVFSFLATDRSVLASLSEFPREYLLLAVALGLVPWFTNALRLLIWTRFLGYPLSYRESFQITLSVDLGSAISPTAVGGGFLKWGMLVQRGISPGAAASITTLPSVEDGIFFAIALPMAVILTEAWKLPVFEQIAAEIGGNAEGVLLVAGAVLFAGWILVRLLFAGGLGARARRGGLRLTARVRRRLRSAWEDAREVFRIVARRGKGLFMLSLLLTAIQWGARYSVVSALIAFLGAPVHPLLYWIFQWVVFTLMTFIPTPGAIGGAEAAFYLIYSSFLPAGVIGLATAGWRFLTFYFQLGLAAILFFLLNVVRSSPAEGTQSA